MTTPLSLWQELLLLAIAALSTIYVFYFRIWLAVAVGSDVLFALALALTVAAIAIPSLFDDASRRLVDRSPLPEALAEADARVAEIEALPRTLMNRALARFGYGPEVDDSDEPDRDDDSESASTAKRANRSGSDAAKSASAPATEALEPIWLEKPNVEPETESSPFVSAVRPSVESLVATILRVASFLCGSFLILTAIAMRSSTTTARRLHQVSERLEGLERAVAEASHAAVEPNAHSEPEP